MCSKFSSSDDDSSGVGESVLKASDSTIFDSTLFRKFLKNKLFEKFFSYHIGWLLDFEDFKRPFFAIFHREYTTW